MKTRLALGLLAVAALTLPNCFFDRSASSPCFGSRCFEAETFATIQNGSSPPETFDITSADAAFAGGMAAIKVFASEECDGSAFCLDTLDDWKRYLTRRFTQGADEEAFRAHFGDPPYCLVEGTAAVTVTDREFSGGGYRSEDSIWPPAVGCGTVADSGCGNPPGVVPRLELIPPSLAFGFQPLGITGSRRLVLISNAGPGRLCLDSPRHLPRVNGNPEDFLLDVANCLPVSDEERALDKTILNSTRRPSCLMAVDFRPSDAGGRWSHVLVRSNDPVSPNRVFLNGIGVAGVLTVSPAGPVCFDGAADPVDGCRRRAFDLHNEGPGAVTVQSAATGSDPMNWRSELAMPLPFTIDPGNTVSLAVAHCAALPEASTLLTIGSNATVRNISVALYDRAACP